MLSHLLFNVQQKLGCGFSIFSQSVRVYGTLSPGWLLSWLFSTHDGIWRIGVRAAACCPVGNVS